MNALIYGQRNNRTPVTGTAVLNAQFSGEEVKENEGAMAGRPAELPIETAGRATPSAKSGGPCMLSGSVGKMSFPSGFQNPCPALYGREESWKA